MTPSCFSPKNILLLYVSCRRFVSNNRRIKFLKSYKLDTPHSSKSFKCQFFKSFRQEKSHRVSNSLCWNYNRKTTKQIIQIYFPHILSAKNSTSEDYSIDQSKHISLYNTMFCKQTTKNAIHSFYLLKRNPHIFFHYK